MTQERIDQVIKGYELRETIGEGGYGVVYRAYQPLVGRDVAVKIILPQFANQPDFIRRFESEAQLVARLEHPYIVPLYDYWREPEGAYLVMRYLRGGNLHNLLAPGPLPPSVLSRVFEQVGGALAVAHRRGVVHRDLKPANILLDDDGNAYLADFGIAKEIGKKVSPYQTDPHTVIGSPAYIAPEQVRAETITPQTDIYSLGVMLYETLTGRLPFEAPTPIAMMFKHVNERIPAVRELRPDLPDAVNAVIQRATAKRPADRYPDVLTMVRELRQALRLMSRTTMRLDELLPSPSRQGAPPMIPGADFSTSMTSPPTMALDPLEVATPNPYKGLQPFLEADAADFFGREVLTQLLLARLQEPGAYQRFLAVVGPSGSGKSSVVRAGLVPALKRGGLPGAQHWFVLELFPGAHPVEELAQALLRIAVDPPNNLVAPLRLDERGLLQVVNQVVPGGKETEVVLVIDQFEEIFTLVEDEAERRHFLNLLISAVTAPYSRIRVIVTLRADFYDRPLLYGGFSELMRQRTEVVVPLSTDELKAAIVGPAERNGLHVDGELVEAIVADVGEQPGALPLLQYALTEVFARRSGPTLTLTPYHSSGGVLGALARRAEELYLGLPEAQQAAARQIFLRLVTMGEAVEDTRRRVRRSELLPAGGDARALDAVIDLYGQYRLLTLDRDPQTRAPTVEVAHEALIRTWTRLRGWLDASREDLRVARRLGVAVGEWAASGQEDSFLARGQRLEQFAGWAAETELALNAEERAYLEASLAGRAAQQAAEDARKAREARLEARSTAFLRTLVGVFAAAAVVAIVLSVYAFQQQQAARSSQQRALAGEQQAQQNYNVAATAQAKAQQNYNVAATAQAKAQQEAGANQKLALASAAQAALYKGDRDNALAIAMVASRQADPLPLAQAVLTEAAYPPGTRRLFRGHTGGVYSVDLSPDGKMVLSGSGDTTLILWDIATGQRIRIFKGHTNVVNSVAFSPDGKTAISGSDDTTLILWDIATGRLIRRFQSPDGEIQTVAFNPNGKTVLSGSRKSTITLWDIATAQPLRTFTGHTQWVRSVKFSPDGKRALSGSDDATVRLWDVATAQPLLVLTGHQGKVNGVAFSPDGKRALSASGDRSVILWDLETGQQIRTLKGHTDFVYSAVFSPDGKTALSSSLDANIGVWDLATGRLVRFLTGHGSGVYSVMYSADGHQAISSSRDLTLRLWDLDDGAEIRRFIGHSALAPGVNNAAIGGVAFSPDGKTIASGSGDRTAILWDAADGRILYRLTNHGDEVNRVAFSPDGKTMVAASNDQTLILSEVATGRFIRIFRGHTNIVLGVAFSPDGRRLVSASDDKTLIIWDVDTGEALHVLKGHASNGTVFGAAFSPDGKTVISCSGDATLILWDAATGQPIRKFTGHASKIRGVAFSPNGKMVLSGSDDKNLILWDVATAKPIRAFKGHNGAVRDVAFSPDGKMALSGSDDNSVIVWDIASGQLLRRFIGHSGPVRSVAFSPDGKMALSGSSDATVRLWRIDSLPVLTAWTQANRYVPDLDCEEEQFFGLDQQHCAAPANGT